VTVVWNRVHQVDSTDLVVYKCSILGSHREHPDCSLCITAAPHYGCTWCRNSCAYKDMCQDAPASECPKPRIDMVTIAVFGICRIEGNSIGHCYGKNKSNKTKISHQYGATLSCALHTFLWNIGHGLYLVGWQMLHDPTICECTCACA